MNIKGYKKKSIQINVVSPNVDLRPRGENLESIIINKLGTIEI